MNWSTGATVGSVILGLGLVILNVGTWWPGRKAMQKDALGQVGLLLPFIFGYAFGTLAILCAGGLLGFLADFTLWGGSWLGDGALIYGVGGMREDVSRGPQQALTNGGHAMTLLLCFVVVVVLRKRENARKMVKQGIAAGVLLGTVRGVAGVMAIPLASSVNFLGAWLSTGVIR